MLGIYLKKYREEHDLRQKDIAEKLGITQAHVSRIESDGDLLISKSLKEKILAITGFTYKNKYDFIQSLEVDSDGHWDFARFVFGGKASGDRIRLNTKIFDSKTVLFHCDAQGHDRVAKHMSDGLVVALEATLEAIQNDLVCTPEFIYKNLNQVIKNIKDFLGQSGHSCNIMVLNRENSKLQVLNAGMPNILLTRRGTKKISIVQDKKWHPLGSSPSKVWPFSAEIMLERGDTLYSFSDGFLDAFKHNITNSLETHILSIAHLLRGDAESIATKLLKTLSELLQVSKADDDLSFAIISKK